MTRLAAALLLVATAALGQVSESITVEVVEVPVYVTAADGTPIRGLTKDAFTLLVNGKPRTIDHFEEIDLRQSAPASAPASAARVPALHERRLYLLLFDLAFTKVALIERAQHASDAAVQRSNPATDYFAVATMTHGGGVRFVIPFMNDYVAVRRAIATLESNDAKDPLGVGLTAKQRKRWAEIEGRAQGVPLAIGFRTGEPYADEIIAGSEVNQQLSRQMLRDDVDREFSGLGTVAARLAALEGQKHVVVFSAGFDAKLFVELGRGYNEDPQMHRHLREMVEAFRGAGAFLDSIDVVGNRPADAAESLRRMAEPTGGETIRNTNDLAAALARLTASHDVSYLLGFRRRDEDAAGEIAVRVAGLPYNARVSYRTGFAKPAPRREIDSLQLADIVVNDLPQNGLSLRLETTPREIAILFRPAEVVAQLVPETPYVEAMLYVLDEHGGTVLFRSKRLPFDAGSAPRAGVAGVREKVKLPPGKYVVKALMHVAGTQSLGFARAELVIP